MKFFYTNREREFISVKLKDFCKKKDISIKYKAAYMHKKTV